MKKIFIAFFVLFLPLTSFANEDEVIFSAQTKTIKELRGDLVDIKKEEKLVEGKIKDFIHKSSLGAYIKKDLNTFELRKLENIVQNYIDNESSLKNTSKTGELFKLKVKLYKDLSQFVQPAQYDLYLKYIEKDTKYIKRQTTIYEKRIKTQTAMDNRVKLLEAKIEKHKSAFNKEIRDLIEKKVEEKIITIFSSEKFQRLTYQKKLDIIGNTLSSIRNNLKIADKKSKTTTNIALQSSIIRKKDVYNIAINKILRFRENLIKTRK